MWSLYHRLLTNMIISVAPVYVLVLVFLSFLSSHHLLYFCFFFFEIRERDRGVILEFEVEWVTWYSTVLAVIHRKSASARPEMYKFKQ